MPADTPPTLLDCLPPKLRGPSTTIARVAAGLSGAGVYRVDVGDARFALKISEVSKPLDDWRRMLQTLRGASEAGVAPRLVHADESRRAVVSEFIAGSPFPPLYRTLATRSAALAMLAHTLRAAHALPIPDGSVPADPRAMGRSIWSQLQGLPLPAFVGDTVRRVLEQEVPPIDRPLVLSHNDINPSNMMVDGDRLLLVDWDVAAPNDPWFDLAVIAMFMRMDEETSRTLLSLHDGSDVTVMPERFTYNRRLTAAMLGSGFCGLACKGGHAGASGEETLENVASMSDVSQQMMRGEVNLASSLGQWAYGLALIKESSLT